MKKLSESTCIWELDVENKGYDTDCGFYHLKEKRNEYFQYCPYCGMLICDLEK